MKIVKTIFKYLVLFLVFGAIYYSIEIIYRGYSHWTMYCLGGLCGIIVGSLNNIIPWEMSLVKQGIIGAIIITLLEFITGLIVNVWLGWNVWDYSNLPLNIMGQISLPFTLAWFVLSIIIVICDDHLRYWWFGEKMPKYSFFSEVSK